LLWAREPVEVLLEDPELEPTLRARFELVAEARAFANEIGLEVGKQYTSYVDWPEDRIVTNVVATAAGSIEPVPFHFPIIGEAPYKGFFDPERARAEAERLRARGMDVCVTGTRAYSTLGWFDDPLTSPMLATGEDRLFETVVHELVHATVFVRSQPDFNEGAANFVGEEAVVAYFARGPRSGGGAEPVVDPRKRLADERVISRAMMEIRDEVAALYRTSLDEAERTRRRADLEIGARARLAALPLQVADARRLSEGARINDACLAIRGTYVADSERYREVLMRLDGDLSLFVARLREVAEADDPSAAFFAP